MRRNRPLRNTATLTFPPPENKTIHQHAINIPAAILTGSVCALGALPILAYLLWQFGLFLLDEAGYQNPDKILATGLINFVVLAFVGIPFLFFLAWLIPFVINRIREPMKKYEIQLKELEIEHTRQKAMLLTQPVQGNSRLTVEQRKLRSLLIVVMDTAYRFISEKGRQYNYSEPKPWSRDQALSLANLIPDYKQDPRGYYPIARQIRTWLQQKKVLNGDEITGEYQRRSDFYALLEKEFHMPVSVNSTPTPSLSQNRYTFIEE